MKKHQCIYKYTKGPQSTKTDETATVTQRGNTDRTTNFFVFFFFFFDCCYMCWCQTAKTD